MNEETSDNTWWEIELDDAAIVVAEFDARNEEVVLLMDLPSPSPQRRPEMLEALLTCNFLERGDLAIRMAMDGLGGRVVQMAELPVQGLTTARVCEALTDFIEHAKPWRDALARDDEADDLPSLLFMQPVGLIRG